MVKHVILWTLKDTLSEEEKMTVKADIKSGLEGLAGRFRALRRFMYTRTLWQAQMQI